MEKILNLGSYKIVGFKNEWNALSFHALRMFLKNSIQAQKEKEESRFKDVESVLEQNHREIDILERLKNSKSTKEELEFINKQISLRENAIKETKENIEIFNQEYEKMKKWYNLLTEDCYVNEKNNVIELKNQTYRIEDFLELLFLFDKNTRDMVKNNKEYIKNYFDEYNFEFIYDEDYEEEKECEELVKEKGDEEEPF